MAIPFNQILTIFFQDDITSTSQENIHCLETILHGPAGSVRSIRCRHDDIRGEFIFIHSTHKLQTNAVKIAVIFADIVFDLVNLVCNLPINHMYNEILRKNRSIKELSRALERYYRVFRRQMQSLLA